MLSEKQIKRYKNNTDKYIIQILDLVKQLNLSKFEERYFNGIINTYVFLGYKKIDQYIIGITNDSFIIDGGEIQGKEYVNIKANYLRATTLKKIIEELQQLNK